MKILRSLYLFVLIMILAPHIKAQFTGKPQYLISTRRAGIPLADIKIELFPLIAPLHVRNFDSLVNDKFFDSTAFHRVVPGFVIQGGDPNSKHGPRFTWGQGDPSQHNVPAEFNPVSHVRGVLSAARDTSINSANSQFFICVGSPTYLDGQYTAYGHVISGMNYVDTIVKAPRDVNDNPYDKIDMFVTYIGSNDSVPPAPTLIAPADGLTNATPSMAFSWNKAATAQVYRLELSKDSLFNVIYFSKEVFKTTYTIPNVDGLTKYYWRVRTNNGGRLSVSSEVRTFTTGVGAATLLSPPNAAINVPVNVACTWNKVPGATSYRLQVANSASFSVGAMVYNQSVITDTTHQVNGLNPGSKFYWRVRSIIDTAEGAYSLKYTFTTMPATGTTEYNTNQISLEQNIPNPTFGKTAIEYSNPIATHVSIKLYDMLGKEVKTVKNEFQNKGKYSLSFDVSGLKPGLYFYRLQAAGKCLVKKMIVLSGD